ncbi:M48 family metallopeptidase [Variovorax sp. Sphag1AA]|uniref:M48 family metallopeptidase n=1 Tax=Variovorax sp. Sphag1AA TaxID=2587027 RepID=UPI00160F259B|nr:M48 family metallopeptidase [Variovorax sp. Sphag1AA]MBB3179347.1 STE24 endopeptidase [Variovorax sp. Sphag1AA]
MPTPIPASLATTLAFALALVAGLVVKFWLASRQVRHVARHRQAVPAAFQQAITLDAHQKAADYTIAKTRLGVIEMAWSAAILLGWTLLGGLDLLNSLLLTALGGGMWQQLALFGAFALIGGILELPFTLWQTFVLEERFGFNKMTWRLWINDAVKGILLGTAIGLPLAALILWLMHAVGAFWWLWAWGVWMSFNLLLMLVYPTFIAPLFNKFQPLDDAALKTRVNALMQRCGFSAKGLFVMDGSTRSAHANAYFTGFGASKRVVFYDTLLRQLNAGEIEAVLAHELGHFKHRHVVKRMVAMFALSLAGFALLGWLSSHTWFYTGLGVQPNLSAPNDALAILLFMLAVPVFGFFVAPLPVLISRKHEFEADAYAIAQTSGKDLSAALLKLYKDNASTLTPDPVFVKFYYSHPPASERLARMAAA